MSHCVGTVPAGFSYFAVSFALQACRAPPEWWPGHTPEWLPSRDVTHCRWTGTAAGPAGGLRSRGRRRGGATPRAA